MGVVHASSDREPPSGEVLEAMSRDLARLEATLDALPVAVYQADDGDRIVLVNDELRRLIGDADPEGRSIGEYYRDPGRREAMLSRARGEGGESSTILELATGRHVEERIRVHRAAGRVHVTGTLTDVTEPVAFERELDRYARMLNSANRELTRQVAALDTFTYAVSHDLKTPLRGLLAYLDALEEELSDAVPDVPEGAREYLQRIRGSGERMERMIRGLLDFTRLQRESHEGDAEPPRIMEEVLETHAHMVNARGVRMDVASLPEHVPVAGPLLRAVLANLVGNAIKYADPDAPRVTVRADEDAEGWTFNVADNGRGIPEEFREHVFKLFFKGPGSEGAGTGVGLAIAHLAVDGWGGRIWVDDAEGGGAAFHFTVPRDVDDAPKTPDRGKGRDT